ncbi:MAG: ECF transporter S component [Bacillota bacterium]|nr:ECF transporter S component [Bacillota bacterium]
MNKKIQVLVTTSMLAALTCVATMVIKVPTIGTNGYVNIGDTMVLISALVLGNPFGAMAAGLGSALADLLAGYAAYVPGTFLIKFLMAYVFCIVFISCKDKNVNTFVSFIIGSILAEIVMVGGYFFYEAVFLGYGYAAATSIPSNMIQGITCIVLANCMLPVLSRMKYYGKPLEARG